MSAPHEGPTGVDGHVTRIEVRCIGEGDCGVDPLLHALGTPLHPEETFAVGGVRLLDLASFDALVREHGTRLIGGEGLRGDLPDRATLELDRKLERHGHEHHD
ncbi:MAG: hypothetical protein M5U19_10170 [Microthrixaceae bacterium]|nr:hypothetical protein [Microthrixaceae bacterium]